MFNVYLQSFTILHYCKLKRSIDLQCDIKFSNCLFLQFRVYIYIPIYKHTYIYAYKFFIRVLFYFIGKILKVICRLLDLFDWI